VRLRPGTGHLIAGLVLLTAGLVVSLLSKEVVWYGAIAVGGLEVARGGYLLARRSS
jgi:hypothetical protein